ncbi:peptide/nickel transport system ATP-binding protein [Pseudoxanthobacter soli DSM 19599]|uniref:Peptide/nickel transport system ATP-binding protein n=1 Tax=Pseudoxanthobacter soli DSM 19599 TaxID=1123029 RepID=A0A1M7ZQ19_9HYPH|nr:ABC transporter ATP-binding protein [Pseudoxanthobacter soli]SHO66961.1 peptide/nickel transport system ATP-binding protein [Pseudoxanthobacter soli DSM 19599]
MDEPPLLSVRGLTIGTASPDPAAPTILDDVDLTLARGETLGIVGESGSGKSTLLLALLGHTRRGLAIRRGSVRFDGIELVGADASALRTLRARRIGFVPQIAATALNPVARIGALMDEALALAGMTQQAARREHAIDLLDRVRLPRPRDLLDRYPHQISGGQQQRVAIALALAGEPDLVVLDEPTSALDPATRVEILRLLKGLIAARGTAMVYVSHDLGVIADVSDRIAVLYAGEVVEEAPTRAAMRRPGHPYLAGLLASLPRLDDGHLPAAIPGAPPQPGRRPAGCRFAPRCALAEPAHCSDRVPLQAIAPDRRVRCRFPDTAREAARAASPVRTPPPDGAPILAIDGVAVRYKATGLANIFSRAPARTVVERISLGIAPGRTLGLVGESGSGKSTILKAIAGLITPDEGSIRFDGAQIAGPVARRSPATRRRIQLIFQNPDASLNPRQSIREIIARPIRLYFAPGPAEVERRVRALADGVRLTARHLDLLPTQLSGGEKQRVAIARAFAAEPDLILADEVTSALDVSVQAAIAGLLAEMVAERGAAMVFVSHDLALVRVLADEVAVLEGGRIVEAGPVAPLFAAPRSDVTRALLASVLLPA